MTAPTNAVVDALNTTLTYRLVDSGWFDPAERIEIGGCVFHPGQTVVTRANNRTPTYGPNDGEWVRNGDRWTVNAGIRDELYVTSLVNGHRHALPAVYIAGYNVTVDYASTITRAQGATVDEAHVITDDRTNSKQLYVGATRGRRGNHIHAAPPAFDLDEHGPAERASEWTPTDAVMAALERQPDDGSAIARRRQLRELSPRSAARRAQDTNEAPVDAHPSDAASERVAAAMRRFQQFNRRPTQGLEHSQTAHDVRAVSTTQ